MAPLCFYGWLSMEVPSNKSTKLKLNDLTEQQINEALLEWFTTLRVKLIPVLSIILQLKLTDAYLDSMVTERRSMTDFFIWVWMCMHIEIKKERSSVLVRKWKEYSSYQKTDTSWYTLWKVWILGRFYSN